mmetsp:Transcript_14636/g.20881  ORF Transcript_14636/g.20881 Transcript_14636/m.20881 type:complete len:193 (-) Transcript_14636:167-745(-)
MSSSISKQCIGAFVSSLSAKQPTPGGGASAAVGAAIGTAAAQMAASYTQRKKDETSGAAKIARSLIEKTSPIDRILTMADEDEKAYADLQRSWKDPSMTEEEKREIESRALAVPTTLMETCHEYILEIRDFLPDCNPNITSDAKVGIHQLAGAARSAYQTVLVNSPSSDEKERLRDILRDIQRIEAQLLELE